MTMMVIELVKNYGQMQENRLKCLPENSVYFCFKFEQIFCKAAEIQIVSTSPWAENQNYEETFSNAFSRLSKLPIDNVCEHLLMAICLFNDRRKEEKFEKKCQVYRGILNKYINAQCMVSLSKYTCLKDALSNNDVMSEFTYLADILQYKKIRLC